MKQQAQPTSIEEKLCILAFHYKYCTCKSTGITGTQKVAIGQNSQGAAIDKYKYS